MLLYMPRRQKASTIFSFRRNGRHSTVENGLTQKGTGFIGPLKILSYAKPVIPRPVRRLVVGIRSLLAGFLFRSDGCFSFVGTVPPTAHFSQQLEKWAKAHTVVSADFQPLARRENRDTSSKPPRCIRHRRRFESTHRRVSRFPATLWRENRDTSSKPPRFIRHRRRFGGFLAMTPCKEV